MKKVRNDKQLIDTFIHEHPSSVAYVTEMFYISQKFRKELCLTFLICEILKLNTGTKSTKKMIIQCINSITMKLVNSLCVIIIHVQLNCVFLLTA